MAQGSPQPLGVGIIGTGFGLMHLLGYRACDNVDVVAVCDCPASPGDVPPRAGVRVDPRDRV